MPRHFSQLRCGSDQDPGRHAGDPHHQTRTRGGTTPILTVALADDLFRQTGLMRRRDVQVSPPRSSFVGVPFPPEVIMVAVRWYLRYCLSYREVEEVLSERGTAVDHGTRLSLVQRFTPLLIDAAHSCRHAPGDRWFVDETPGGGSICTG